MPSLDRLVSASRRAVEERREQLPLHALEDAAADLEPIRPFTESLSGEEVAFVLKLEAADNATLEEAEQARVAGLVVPTESADDGDHGLERLRTFAADTGLPLLQSDVIVDAYQLYEARLAGADGIILIATVFDDDQRLLQELDVVARAIGLDVVVDVREEEEIERALEAIDPESFLIRNYVDDKTVDFERTFSLLEEVPAGKVVLSQGGVRTRDQAVSLGRAGVDGIVLGPWVLEDGIVPTLRMLRGDWRS
jgi:indole-3-glycerol phosphate synthase